MYLYLGGGVIVKKKDIIGIFELDGNTTTDETFSYLRNCENRNILFNPGEKLPKSFVTVMTDEGEKVFFSHYAVSSLLKKNESSV